MADYTTKNSMDNATEHKNEFSISIDTDIYDKCSEIFKQSGLTFDEAIRRFIHFCSKPENRDIIVKWYANYIADEEKRTGSLNFDILPHFKSEQLQDNFENICEEARMGCSPIVIEHSGKNYLLFDWNDYMNRFGSLYSEEQINELNKACEEFKEW